MITLLAAESQQVTAWPQRLLLTLGVLAVSALAVWGCGAVGSDEALDLPLQRVPAGFEPDLEVVGRYLGTSPAQDWMQRVVAGGPGCPGQRLGQRGGAGRTSGTHRGIVDLPAGRPDHRHRTRPRVAAQVAEKDGVVLWFWSAGDTPADGISPDAAEDVVRLVDASRASEENR